jgi:hypothetical protein
MARIDVEKAIEELTLGEKVDLTAGKDNSQCSFINTNANHPQAKISGTQPPSHA